MFQSPVGTVNFLESNAINALHNWTNLHEDTNIAFNKALDVFIEICNNCNAAQINNECNFLLQEENKVRDAIHLQNSIKHKTSRLKTKISTKIQNKMDAASNSLGSSMDILKNKLKTPLGGPASNNNGETEGEVAEEAFNRLYEEAKVIAECDRILRNYDKICKRFDLDKIVSEVYSTDDIYESIIELCSCIDTYRLPFIKKYNTALEIANYTLGKNYMNYESKKIIEAVTDYFIFNTNISDSNRNDMKIIANNSVDRKSVV